MRIISIQLVGYKRLALANIQSLTYSPESAFQLILGTNGSGKSSLLQELSPLPAASSDFLKGGSKCIKLLHRGSEYVLTSTFKSGNHHSFVKDGEELNSGGTGQVQKELVRNEFNYTQDLHEILIGRERFTTMAPMKRREWITRLSSCDYTYALGVFNRLKAAARDAQGAVKHTKQRLLQETNNLRTFGNTEGLAERAEMLRNELTALLSSRAPDAVAMDVARHTLRQHLSALEELSRRVIDTPARLPDVTSASMLEERLNEVTQQLTTVRSLHQRASTEYSELDELLHSLGAGAQLSPEQLQRKIQELQDGLTQLVVDNNWVGVIHDPVGASRDTDAVLSELIQALQALPDNSDGTYSRERLQSERERLTILRGQYDSATAKLRQIHLKLEHIRHAEDQTCPQCEYRWKPGVDASQQGQLESWQQAHQQNLEQLELDIRQIEAYLEAAAEYAKDYGRIRTLLTSYPRLQPLTQYLIEQRCLTDRPAERVGVLHRWHRTVAQVAEQARLQDELNQLLELQARQASLGEVGLLAIRQERLQEELRSYTRQLEELRVQHQQLKTLDESYRQWRQSVEQLEELLRKGPQLLEAHRQALRNQHIDQVVGQHHNELAVTQRKLTEHGSMVSIVQDLQQDHEGLDRDWKALLLLTQALSPTEGLIAEQLTGFIQCLVAQMNSVIAAVWTQELKILPCGQDDAELDYKFPLQSGAHSEPNVDIAYGSTAQVEIVNLAFKLTAMLYLGMTDYPLYLDELGAAFDEQHRINVMNFIRQLMEVNQHSQMFLISHYAANHGAFTNAQVLVLDGANIAVPGEYNKHVVIG